MKQMPAGIKPLSADARMLDLQPMRKLHSDIFPNVMSPPHPDPRYQQHNANGYYSESEEGSEQPDAMQQGQQFLQHSGYSEDERSEFYFLLEQGFSVEEAKDFIQQRRDNIAQKTANMAASPRVSLLHSAGSVADGCACMQLEHKSSKDEANVRELSPAISYSSSQEYHRDSHYQRGVRPSDVGPAPSAASQPPRAIKPLRVDDLCGDFDQDINLLLNNGYDIEQAREICDQVYASRGYSRHPPIPAPAPAPAPAPMHVQTPPQHAPVQFAQRERGMSRSDSPSMGQGAPPKVCHLNRLCSHSNLLCSVWYSASLAFPAKKCLQLPLLLPALLLRLTSAQELPCLLLPALRLLLYIAVPVGIPLVLLAGRLPPHLLLRRPLWTPLPGL